MDQLHIKDLKVYAYHGVLKSEKELGQQFVLDVFLDYDMTKAAKTGDLSATIHYGELSEDLTSWCLESKEDLIESLALKLINKIFLNYPLARKVSVEVKKPWAPVPLSLDVCSVKMERKKYNAYIGLGSNQGDKMANLDAALEKLAQHNIKLIKTSSRIETKPWGGVVQENFLNQVAEIETWLTPKELLQTLLEIEAQIGRVRDIRWGPRLIDLDILYIGQEKIYSSSLIVPHPYVAERAFVLKSLLEIAPHFTDPRDGRTIRQLWYQVDK